MDLAATVYLVILVSMGVNISMLIWWAYVYPKISTIFRCIVCLFAALWYSVFLSYISRIHGVDWYFSIHDDWWWITKNVPLAAVSAIIMFIFIHRVLESPDPVE